MKRSVSIWLICVAAVIGVASLTQATLSDNGPWLVLNAMGMGFVVLSQVLLLRKGRTPPMK